MNLSHALTILIQGKNLAAPALKEATKGVQAVTDKIAESGKALDDLGKKGPLVFRILGAGISDLLKLVTGLTVGLIGLVSGFFALATAATLCAQKLESSSRAFQGILQEDAPAMLQALRETSRFMLTDLRVQEQYVSAYMLTGEVLAKRMPEAYQYLGKVALATHDDLDFLVERLYRSVGRLSTRWMAYIGTVVELDEATAHAAKMFGVLEKDLTRTQIQAGMLDRVLQKLAVSTARLPEILGTTEQMANQVATSYKNLRNELGTHFLPVARSWYSLLIQLQQATHVNISAGGKWYDVLRRTSATLSVVIDMVGELAAKLSGVGKDSINSFADTMAGAAWKAFSWGANIINNLAIGIVRGATTVLIKAIQFIGGILAHWMAPGSPPRFLANIVAWGTSAFTEFLRGFTQADFSVLTSLQQPLQAVLRNLFDIGDLPADIAGSLYKSLTEDMTAAIAYFSETGEVSAEVLAKLTAIGGGYGKELAELFRRQLAVAAATGAMADAQRRLSDARSIEEASGKKLSRQAREYNRLLQEGASAEVLRAKLAEVRATYVTLDDAREAHEIAEADLDIAKAKSEEVNNLAQLQASLLQQLIDMQRIQFGWLDDIEDIGDDLVDLELPFADVIPTIDEAFLQMKKNIRAQFQALWEELKADWEESGVGKLMEKLKAEWEKSGIQGWIDEFIFDVKEEGLKAAVTKLWVKLATAIQNMLDAKGSWFANVWRAFTQEGIEDGTGKVSFGGALTALWVAVSTAIQNKLDEKGSWFAETWRAFTKEGIDDGSGKVSFGEALAVLWETIKKGLNTLVSKVGVWLGKLVTGQLEDTKEEGKTLGSSFVEGLVAGLLSGLLNSEEMWKKKLGMFIMAGVNLIRTLLGGRTGESGQKLGALYVIGLGMGRGIREGWEDGILPWHETVALWAGRAIVQIKDLFRTHSRSQVMYDIGRDMGQGLIDGFDSVKDGIKSVLNTSIWFVERAVNGMIDGINTLLRGLRAIPGAGWLPTLGHVYLPRLAEGGLVTAAEQLAVLHGPEVILPLDNPKTMTLLRDAMGAAMDIRGGSQRTTVEIHNHFGQNSVRSQKDIRQLSDQINHSLRLSGVKVAM